MYSFIKKKTPLYIKRKVVLCGRFLKFFMLSMFAWGRFCLLVMRNKIVGAIRVVKIFFTSFWAMFKKEQSFKKDFVSLGEQSASIEKTVDAVSSYKKPAVPLVPIKLIKPKRVDLLSAKLSSLNRSVDLLLPIDVASSGSFLVFVDSGAARKSFTELMDILLDRNARLLFKVKNDYSDFFTYLSDSDFLVDDFSERVFYLSTIDAEIDDVVYNIADSYADFFVKELSGKFSSSPNFSGIASSLASLRVTISDRLVGWVRTVVFIERFLRAKNISRFYMYGGGGIDGNILAFCIRGGEASVLKVNVASKLVLGELNAFVSRQWQPAVRSVVTRYAIVDACHGASNVIIFVGNLKDPQYKETNEPIISALSSKSRSKIVVISSHAQDFEAADNCQIVSPSLESDPFHAIDELNLLLDEVIDLFVLAGFEIGEHEGLVRLYSSMNSRRSFQRLFRDCLDLKGQVDELCSQATVSAIVSCPGRLWSSQFLVGYLKDAAPSFEIQSGTLSMTTRYKKPNSKYILSVDDFSSRVYVDFLGVEGSNVEVVGAPRIDSKLSYIRNYSQAESRALIFNGAIEDKIICIATQPYGVEVMSAMVEVVANFVAKNPGWYMLISMHPNENSMYESSYKALLSSRLPSSRFSMSKGNIYHNLNASSKVVTYFSTSGLEAFCLDKDVFTYRPFSDVSVPFDLADLGVALPFTNADEFSELMCRDRVEGDISESLLRLKDGASIERICSAVLRFN